MFSDGFDVRLAGKLPSVPWDKRTSVPQNSLGKAARRILHTRDHVLLPRRGRQSGGAGKLEPRYGGVYTGRVRPCHRADEAGECRPYGADDSAGFRELIFLTHYKGNLKGNRNFQTRKNPSKPCGSKGFLWWTIQDSNL